MPSWPSMVCSVSPWSSTLAYGFALSNTAAVLPRDAGIGCRCAGLQQRQPLAILAASDRSERLLEIRDDVSDIFDTRGEAQ